MDSQDIIRELAAIIVRERERLGLIDQVGAAPTTGHAIDGPHARAYRIRRMRDEVFGEPGLFGEPAWDILLALAAAERGGKTMTVNELCAAARVSPNAALRYIEGLFERGLIERGAKSGDSQPIALSAKARSNFDLLFWRVERITIG